MIVSGLTLFSRVLGFIRDMLIAHYFGVNGSTDAFFAAFRFPNLLRRLFAEGSFAQAFVPILSDQKEQNLQPTINKIAGHLALLLAFLTLIGIIVAPILIWFCAAGFQWQSEQHVLATRLLQIMLPYGFFVTLVAFLGSVLNAHSRFAIPAFTPALLNLAMIGATIFLSRYVEQPIFALAIGVLIGGFLQLIFQIPVLWRLNLLPKFQLDFQDKQVKRLFKNLLPTLFASSAAQINLLINTFIASFLVTGSVSWLYYADRLLEFPLGILGSGLATVMLPKLSQCHALQDKKSFSKILKWGLYWVVLLGIPATLGLVLLAEPTLHLLFESQEFTAKDVHASAQSLQGYALGLIGFLTVKILTPALTTQNLHSIAVRYAWICVGANLIFNALFFVPFAHAGVALATACAAILNAGMLLRFLRQNRFFV